MGSNRDNSLSRGRLSTAPFLLLLLFLFFTVCHVCLRLEHTVCFWGSWRVFQIVLVPREHCACVESHVYPLRLCCAGVMVNKGELFPLWSLRKFTLRRHWTAEFQLGSCWLVADSWILPRDRVRKHVTVFTLSPKFTVELEDFPRTPLLLPVCCLLRILCLKLMSPLKSTGFRCVCMLTAISLVKSGIFSDCAFMPSLHGLAKH